MKKNYEPLLNCKANAELARRKFLDFVINIKENYIVNWHHKVLCEKLDEFISGKITRLMVFMPPQHGKSELVSRNLPAYILGKDPKAKIVVASYSDDLSSGFNRDCQSIIDSQPYHEIFPNTILNESNVVTVVGSALRNSKIFEVVGHKGFLKSVGVGKPLTGTTADYAIIDDPVKDSLEAMSSTYQIRNWRWYNDVLKTRLHNKSKVLITQTRWDVKDLSGMLIQSMQEGYGEKWEILCLPAIKENTDDKNDPRGTGEALWPEMHSKERIMQIQRESIRTYQSLYQQNPQPVETGGEFYKQFRIYKHVGKTKYNPAIPLHISFDFNVNPYMTCTIWQISGKVAVQIMELCLKTPMNTTKGICIKFQSLFPHHKAGLFIYGDPSGRNEDTRSEKGHNDYRVILMQLQAYKPQVRVFDAHPAVAMRANFINAIFESNFGGISLSIDEKCTETLNDYLYMKEDSDGTKLKSKAKDHNSGATYEKFGHTSDANDYFLCFAFQREYIEYQRGDTLPKITLGKNISKNTW